MACCSQAFSLIRCIGIVHYGSAWLSRESHTRIAILPLNLAAISSPHVILDPTRDKTSAEQGASCWAFACEIAQFTQCVRPR